MFNVYNEIQNNIMYRYYCISINSVMRLICAFQSLNKPSTSCVYINFWKWRRNDQGRPLTSIKTGNKNTGRLVVIFHTRTTRIPN